ncbi:MAG: hypothetical protein KGH79_00845 [Patescibacteria group bacterium]|nr:hypothetical protein [Patescibacteria group bacterium]
MRAKIWNTRGILGLIALALVAVLLYSAAGAFILHAGQSAAAVSAASR